uniref:WASH_WAHD domain-containing protein n=1 Tax=Panagrellus redivivus TaxID=6233 RepID=A0A7E4W6R6_PANRE
MDYLLDRVDWLERQVKSLEHTKVHLSNDIIGLQGSRRRHRERLSRGEANARLLAKCHNTNHQYEISLKDLEYDTFLERMDETDDDELRPLYDPRLEQVYEDYVYSPYPADSPEPHGDTPEPPVDAPDSPEPRANSPEPLDESPEVDPQQVIKGIFGSDEANNNHGVPLQEAANLNDDNNGDHEEPLDNGVPLQEEADGHPSDEDDHYLDADADVIWLG